MPQTLDDRIVEIEQDDNRRTSTRMPQAGGRGKGKLKIGSRMVEVDILDESSGGYMVGGAKIPKTVATRPVHLVNSSGSHPLRVVWRRSVDGQTRMGLQRLPEHINWKQESSWFIWMLAAMILGFGIGYVVAFRDRHDLAKRIVELSTPGQISNEHAVKQPAETPSPSIGAPAK